jgi:hypothetical protein
MVIVYSYLVLRNHKLGSIQSLTSSHLTVLPSASAEGRIPTVSGSSWVFTTDFPSRLRDGCIPPRQRFHAAMTSHDIPDPPASTIAAPRGGFCAANKGGVSRRK